MLKHGSKFSKQCFHAISFSEYQYKLVTSTRKRLHVSVVDKFTKISLRTYAANLKSKCIQRTWFLPITENNVKLVADTLESREKLILLNHLLKLYANKDVDVISEPKKQSDFLERVDSTLKEQTQKLEAVDKITQFIKCTEKTPSKKEVLNLSIHAGLPYFIFGYLDNFLMVIFGDILDAHLGPMGYSSLTSAALGNMVSDVISVLLSVYIEKLIRYFSNFAKVQISEAQLESGYVKRIVELSKPVSVALGTLMGMWPLYFL